MEKQKNRIEKSLIVKNKLPIIEHINKAIEKNNSIILNNLFLKNFEGLHSHIFKLETMYRNDEIVKAIRFFKEQNIYDVDYKNKELHLIIKNKVWKKYFL
jgi:hypothetical protein